MSGLHILFLSRWFPYPIENGAKIRIFNLLKGLSDRNTVDLISFYADEDVKTGADHLREFVDDICIIPYRSFQPGSLKSLMGFFTETPRSVADTYSEELAETVSEFTARKIYDVVIASEIDMAIYGLAVHGPKKVFEELEVTKILSPYQNETRPLKKLRNGLTWWKLSRYVNKILDEYDGSTVVSEEERSAAEKINPGRAPVVIPNGVDCAYYRTDPMLMPDADTLIYNGSITYDVNFKAVAHFIVDILPLIQAQRPQVRLYITGKIKQELIDQLPRNAGVIFTGFLEDIRPVLSRSWLNVVPLTIGGGTRLKILESLAAGVPVVSTRIGAEGLDLVHGRDLLIADQPIDFADAVLSVLQAPALRARLAESGRLAVETRYDWTAINQKLDRFLTHLVAS